LPASSNQQVDIFKTSARELRIRPLFHGSVLLEFGGKIIEVDRGAKRTTPISPADMIVIPRMRSLDHPLNDKIRQPGTIFVAARCHRYPQLRAPLAE